MEKIYMEDSQSQQSRRSRSQIRLSVVLSFVVAFFAIFSLIACGVSQVSYAAPTDGDNTSWETGFTFKIDSYETLAYGNGTDFFMVPRYYKGSTNESVFCIEPKSPTNDGVEYSTNAENEVDDYGLLYLLSQFYEEDGSDADVINFSSSYTTVPAQYRKYINNYIKQAAVWSYVAQKQGFGVEGNLSASEHNLMVNPTTIKIVDTSSDDPETGSYLLTDVSIIKTKISELVTAAQNATDYLSAKLEPLSDSVAKDDNGNYVMGYRIVNNPSNVSANNYTITIEYNGELVFGNSYYQLVNSNGQTLESNVIDCTSGTCDTDFYVVVNKDLISELNKNYVFNVKLNASFDTLNGYRYSAINQPNLQKVISVNGIALSSDDEKEFIVSADNTGMTTAQTIYFIGLVVLLCGIGIVYANAKPAESKQ